MASRLELHEELCKLLGTRYVYFQPPENVKMYYPCIVYSVVSISQIRADNRIYKGNTRYQLTVIDRDPDSMIYDKIMHRFEMCSFDRAYAVDNLYHNVLTIYY